jgi:peptidyl-prolyl cis-trans isomerase SurA
MTWSSRLRWGFLFGSIGLLSPGCQGGPTAGFGGRVPGPMVAMGTEPDAPSVIRAQLPDPSPPQAFKPATALKTPLALPSPQTDLLPKGNPLLPVSNTVGAQQAAALLDGSEVRVKIRAWVNGRPIFNDELMQMVGPSLRDVVKMPEPQRTEKVTEMFSTALDHLVDQEVLYQDAVKMLQKANPRALDKLKELVGQDYDKQVTKMHDDGVPDEYIRATAHVNRRMLERNLISMEYAQNRVDSYIKQQITLDQIQTYYKEHLTEFQNADKVQWQDVFIAVGPKYPTPADVRRLAEDLIAKCRNADDFAKLLTYDDGDSKFRGGEGFGQVRGKIRPPEIEPILFQLKEGQIGPVVELPTGVHLFRVLKREYAGQLPLNEQTQKAIRRKLENVVREREIRQLVRDLRARSVIRIVSEGN